MCVCVYKCIISTCCIINIFDNKLIYLKEDFKLNQNDITDAI